MDHLYTPSGHTYVFGGDECLDLYVISDGEWEYNHDTGGSSLRVTDAEPAVCNFPAYDINRILADRAGKCEKFFDPIPF